MTAQRFYYFAAAFLLLFVFGLLYPFEFGYHDVVIKRLGDAFHLPLFLLLTIIIWKLIVARLGWNNIAATLLAAGISLAAGYFTEIIQPLTGRSESWADLRNGMLGVLVFMVWQSLIARRSKLVSVALTGGLFIALFYYAMKPAIAAYELRRYQRASFPTLADFSHTPILNLWKPSDSGEPAAQALLTRTRKKEAEDSYLQVTTTSGKFSGIEFDAYGFSWTGYESINFEITNPNLEPLKLNIRIDDCGNTEAFGDRFNGTIVLASGLNRQTIPLREIAGSRSGKFQLDRIRRILIFVDPARSPQSFDLRKIWLSR